MRDKSGSDKKRSGKSSPAKKAIEGLGLGLAVGVVCVLLATLHVFDTIENTTWDLRVRSFPSAPDPRIKIVTLDQDSLNWGEKVQGYTWPWPREVYSIMIKYLKAAGASSIGFDVVFTENSGYGVDDDAALGKAITEAGNYVQVFTLSREANPDLASAWSPSFADPPFKTEYVSPIPGSLSMKSATFPVADIASGAASLANAHVDPDSDAIFRRSPLIWTFAGKTVPSLGLASYLVSHPGSTITRFASSLEIRSPLPVPVVKTIPLDPEGNAILHYRTDWAHSPAHYSAKALIQSAINWDSGSPQAGDLNPVDFKGANVFFGFSATGLLDLRPSPVDPAMPGVAVNALVLDNLLKDDFMSPANRVLQGLFVVLLSLAAGLAIRFSHNWLVTVGVFVGFLAVAPASAWIAYGMGYWLALVPTLLSVLLTLLGGIVVNYASEGRDKRFIKSAFGQYLSPIVIERLIQNPDLLKLGGEKRNLTILFSDVQGFTSISENLDPEELTTLLNHYLSEVTTIIYDCGGTMDKYEGDAVIAFWNAPLDLADHAKQAILASLRYQKKVEELQGELMRLSKGVRVVARIGLNTGPVVVGNMGSKQRFNYTFFGDAGNLASRLEGMNKQFGTYFMVSEFTKREAGDIEGVEFRELSRVAVVGKSEAVTVYEPMETSTAEAKRSVLNRFAEGRELYYEGKFAEAMKVMQDIADEDPPAKHYVRKLADLIAAPPADWAGVWVSTEK